jgi:hypothetical protein
MLGQIRAHPLVELHQEKFVIRIRGLKKLYDRFTGAFDLAAHAAAHIEDYAQGNRRILARKMADILHFLALKYAEVLLVQTRHQAVHGIGNGHRNQDQIDVYFYRFGVSLEPGVDHATGCDRRGCWQAGIDVDIVV